MRSRFHDFKNTFESLKLDLEGHSCYGLKLVANKISEPLEKKFNPLKNLEIRLIGARAISLTRYRPRLVDSLYFPNESFAQMIKRLVLVKTSQRLRDIVSVLNLENLDKCYYTASHKL